MAECLLNRLGKGRFKAFSAGSHPTGKVHPLALELLRSHDHDVDHLRSKDWSEFAGDDQPVMDFIITVCDQAAGETCPVWPGQPVSAHWGFEDPAAAAGTEAQRMVVFARVYEELRARLELLVGASFDQHDRSALRKRIQALATRQAGASI